LIELGSTDLRTSGNLDVQAKDDMQILRHAAGILTPERRLPARCA
jgi:hypothetical protein